MEEKEVKQIRYMSDFANLFLAMYSLRKTTDDGKLYICKYFNDIIRNIMVDSNFEINGLLNEEGLFDVNNFMEKLEHSNIREYWANDLNYDLKRDYIYTKMNIKRAESEIKKYKSEEIQLISQIVEEVIDKENEYNDNELQNEIQERKYTYLFKKSDD